MIKIFTIEMIKTALHDDIIVSSIASKDLITIDSYHMIWDMGVEIDEEPELDFDTIRNLRLNKLFNSWIKELRSEELKIFLPIDFSDEYTGGFEIDKVDEFNCYINYSFSLETPGRYFDFNNLDLKILNISSLIRSNKSTNAYIKINDLYDNIKEVLLQVC